MCVCVCVCFNHFFWGGMGGGGGEGAFPVRVKDPILLIHGSLKESSPYKTGVYYIEYLLSILERDCSSMHRRKEDKLQH